MEMADVLSSSENYQDMDEKDDNLSNEQVTVPNKNADNVVLKKEESGSKKYDLSKVADVVSLVKEKEESEIAEVLRCYISDYICSNMELSNYHCIFLFDLDNSISRNHADRIYQSIRDVDNEKDIILFLRSRGGRPEPAYLISKLCNRYKKNKFIVSVPAEAKSAATLISFGADEIHMGPMSELGPIDIQVDGLPLLSISSTLEKIASIVEKYPKSSKMFSDYLVEKLDIGLIGYYDRVTESAELYARMLLGSKYEGDSKRNVKSIASRFINHYKDHGFVIDTKEAQDILGHSIVKEDTDIHDAGSKILSVISNIENALLLAGKQRRIMMVGSWCGVMNSEPDDSDVDSCQVLNGFFK